jgi:PAS domain S-box-containing protein
MSQDADELIALRRRLQQSDDRLAALLNSALDCIVTMDGKGVILEFNPAAERIFRYSRSQAIGRTVEELLVPARLREAHRRGLEAYHQTGSGPVLGRRVEIDALREDGSEFPVELAIVPTMVDGQQSFTAFIRDLTDRKRAEQALREGEARFRRLSEYNQAVVDNMAEGLYTVDTHGLVTYINPAAESIFGWASGELLGRKMHDVTHYQYPDGRPFPASECAGLVVLQKGIPLREHHDVFIRKDRTFFPVIYSASPLQAEGKTAGLVVAFRDDTERRRAEEERERLLQQLQEKIGDLERFHDVAVGREMKMIEMEKQLARLRQERSSTEGL